jgi:hypothetical protein
MKSAERTEKSAEISYAEFGKIPKPRVPGHAGRFVFGKSTITELSSRKGASIFMKDFRRAKSLR